MLSGQTDVGEPVGQGYACQQSLAQHFNNPLELALNIVVGSSSCPPTRADSSNTPGGDVVNQMGITAPSPNRSLNWSDSNLVHIRFGKSGPRRQTTKSASDCRWEQRYSSTFLSKNSVLFILVVEDAKLVLYE